MKFYQLATAAAATSLLLGKSHAQQQQQQAIVRGIVFSDLNQNGLRDTTAIDDNNNDNHNNTTDGNNNMSSSSGEEVGISGMTIQLRSCNPNDYGTKVDTTISDDEGYYSFIVVDNGTGMEDACYYLRMDANRYAFTNLDNLGRTGMISLFDGGEEGEEVVWNVGVLVPGTAAVVEDGTTAADSNTDATATATTVGDSAVTEDATAASTTAAGDDADKEAIASMPTSSSNNISTLANENLEATTAIAIAESATATASSSTTIIPTESTIDNVEETTVPATTAATTATTTTTTTEPTTTPKTTTTTSIENNNDDDANTNTASYVSLGGIIYHDINQNGKRDNIIEGGAQEGELEPGIAGVSVTLYSCSGSNGDDDLNGNGEGTVMDTRTTNSIGQYFFGNFGFAGCYYLRFFSNSGSNGDGQEEEEYSFKNGGRSYDIEMEDGDYFMNRNFGAISVVGVGDGGDVAVEEDATTTSTLPTLTTLATSASQLGGEEITSVTQSSTPANESTNTNTVVSSPASTKPPTNAPTTSSAIAVSTPSVPEDDTPSSTVAKQPSGGKEGDAAKTPANDSSKTPEGGEGGAGATTNSTIIANDNGNGNNETKADNTNDSSTTSDINILIVNSKVRIQLENILQEMNIEAQSLFEEVCSSFLNEQLRIATPPIYNIQCDVVGQSVETSNRRRGRQRRLGDSSSTSYSIPAANDGNSEQEQRMLASTTSLMADVDVTGEATKTDTITEASQIKFKDLVTGTFTVQGFVFVRELKNEENARTATEGGGTATTMTSSSFQSIENVRGVLTYDALGAQELEDGGDGSGDGLAKGVIAAIVLGGVVFLMLGVFIMARVVEKRRPASSTAAAVNGSRNSSSSSNVRRPKEDFFANIKNNGTASKKKTSTTGTVRSTKRRSPPIVQSNSSTSATASPRSQNSDVMSHVSSPIASSSGEVEIGIIPPSFSGGSTNKNQRGTTSSSLLNSRIQRDVMAPSGKLGILVANTAGYGPAVHTVRPGSPMEGLIFVNDIIIAVNDVNTREWTAEQITQVMKDTIGEERKITVLSSHR